MTDRVRGFPAFPARPGRGPFARTWWGRAWLQAMEDTALDLRQLKKGRSYAAAGLVGPITVSPGLITATTEDADDGPYRTGVHLAELSTTDWELLLDRAADHSGHLAALLDRHLPPELAEVVPLLPGIGDLDPDCDCPGWELPCLRRRRAVVPGRVAARRRPVPAPARPRPDRAGNPRRTRPPHRHPGHHRGAGRRRVCQGGAAAAGSRGVHAARPLTRTLAWPGPRPGRASVHLSRVPRGCEGERPRDGFRYCLLSRRALCSGCGGSRRLRRRAGHASAASTVRSLRGGWHRNEANAACFGRWALVVVRDRSHADRISVPACER